MEVIRLSELVAFCCLIGFISTKIKKQFHSLWNPKPDWLLLINYMECLISCTIPFCCDSFPAVYLFALRIRIFMLNASNVPPVAHHWRTKVTSIWITNCIVTFMLNWRHHNNHQLAQRVTNHCQFSRKLLNNIYVIVTFPVRLFEKCVIARWTAISLIIKYRYKCCCFFFLSSEIPNLVPTPFQPLSMLIIPTETHRTTWVSTQSIIINVDFRSFIHPINSNLTRVFFFVCSFFFWFYLRVSLCLAVPLTPSTN